MCINLMPARISLAVQNDLKFSIGLVVRSIKHDTYQVTPRSNLFHQNTTGAALISAMLWRTRCFKASFEGSWMCRRKARAIFEKAHLIRFSHEHALVYELLEASRAGYQISH